MPEPKPMRKRLSPSRNSLNALTLTLSQREREFGPDRREKECGHNHTDESSRLINLKRETCWEKG
jgi:hypothetical protein